MNIFSIIPQTKRLGVKKGPQNSTNINIIIVFNSIKSSDFCREELN